ncbi:MAG TPA: DnaJ C-terminal domain-containing protein [Oxalicibacterium sp.]|uniref:DnaJ C-terminal domain-containing protein n=1 Tax=Oxalicibacterium sp. TaxID=2766525 RepID=UPI002D10F940|nr:DnaJ C-terminal domain-containing protein [Oxalicibacterium sp.]HWU98127.1 DnaJ C-terminal domain-containing protein [Oxalicibacterium sp.]
MKFKDYYETLGVKRDATQDDIKNAYRKLARKYHPDVSKEGDAEERFKEVGEAYKVLKEPESRASYDRLGANWQNDQDFRPPPGAEGGFEFRTGAQNGAGFDGADFGDFFEQMFSRQTGRQRTMHMPGEDHHAKIQIDLEDAYRGAERSITLRLPEMDETGHLVNRTRTLSVNIPKGIRAGQNLRLAGQGGAGIGGGQAGDLYLEIAFRPHPHYRVDGADVYMDLPLAPWEAALGATVNADTPAGPVELTIPPNSTAGRKLRLKGKGIPAKEAGNLYVILAIALPPADSEEAKQAYRAMKDAFDFNPRA